MTEYQTGRFTARDAEALVGRTADITEWDGDEFERKITYPGATVTGIIDKLGYLNIRTSGAMVTDAATGAYLTDRPAEEDWNVSFSSICEVTNVRDLQARRRL